MNLLPSGNQMPKPVLTKDDFVKRYQAGEFGNRSPTWSSLLEFYGNHMIHPDSLFHLRNRVKGGPSHYNQSGKQLLDYVQEGKFLEPNWYVSEMCPTEKTLIQGEISRMPNGLYFYYSTVVKPMRDSLAEGGKESLGLQTSLLLDHFLDHKSREWLNYLLDEYPDHVIEFTTLSQCWGVEPGYNTIFWEVRKY